MPPRPIVPTWEPRIVGGTRMPRLLLTGGITGQLLDAINGRNEEMLQRAMSQQTEERADQQAAAGRAAGIQAGRTGAEVPKSSSSDTFGFLFGKSPSQLAFDKGAKTGYLAGLSNRVKNGLAETAEASGDDPQKFAAGVDGLRAKFGDLPPELRADVDLDIEEGAVRYAGDISQRNAKRAREQSTLQVRDALGGLGREAQWASASGDIEAAKAHRNRWQVMAEAGIQDGALSGEWVADHERMLDGEMVEHGVLGRFNDALEKEGYLGARRFQDDFRRQAAQLDVTPDQADRLYGSMDRVLDARQRDAERAERTADRARTGRQDSAFKDIVRMREEGTLTWEALLARSGRLSDSQFKQGQDMLRMDRESDDRGRTDPQLYTDLLARQNRGENVAEDARKAYVEHRLSYETYNRVVGDQEKTQNQRLTSGRKYLEQSLKGTGLLSNLTDSRAYADADRDFVHWYDKQRAAGHEPTQDEVNDRAGYLARSYGSKSQEKPAGRMLYEKKKGEQTDWPATLQETQRAFERGELSQDELDTELSRLASFKKWQDSEKDRLSLAPSPATARPSKQPAELK